MFCEKKGVLKNFAKSHRKTSVLEHLFNKVVGLQAYSDLQAFRTKSNSYTSVFLCEIFEINTYFKVNQRTNASETAATITVERRHMVAKKKNGNIMDLFSLKRKLTGVKIRMNIVKLGFKGLYYT